MKYLFISIDYTNDTELIPYLHAWKRDESVFLLQSDFERLKAARLSTCEIKEHMQRQIDSSDCVLIVAGEYANDKSADSDEIGEVNWQHYVLRHAIALGKPMRGIKLFRECEIPRPLKGVRGLHWRVLSGRRYNEIISELFSAKGNEAISKS